MAETGNKKPGFLKNLLTGFIALMIMGLVYLAAILLQSPADALEGSFVVDDGAETVSRMQPAQENDAHSLAALFEAPLPMLPGYTPRGQAGNTAHDGQNVRVASLQYDGLVITAVRPAGAAPLLLREEMSVSLAGDIALLNHPAVLATKGDAYCVYFSTESAAYSVYTPKAALEDFLAVIARLVWAD